LYKTLLHPLSYFSYTVVALRATMTGDSTESAESFQAAAVKKSTEK